MQLKQRSPESLVTSLRTWIVEELGGGDEVVRLPRPKLFDFFQESWSTLEPGRKLHSNWHQELICEYLELVSQGQIKRLLINIAPRHLKSSIVSIGWPCWEWIDDPWLRYLCLSYSDRLAVKHSLKRRLLIKSRFYQSRFSDRFILTKDNDQKTEFTNNEQGQMYAASLGGTVVGEGGERIIVDDPHNPDEVESDKQRDSRLEQVDEAITTRLNDPESGAVVVVMQRLHEKDCSGHILADVGGYVHLCLPTEAEEPQTLLFPLSRKYVTRNPGDFLHPERFGAAQAEEAQRSLGAYKYAGRHQQRPVPAGGGMFQSNWWKYYKELPPLKEFVISVDATFGSQTQTASYVVIQLWGIGWPNFYLIDQVRARMGFAKTKAEILGLIARREPELPVPVREKLIEKKANGAAIIEALQQELPGVIAISPTETKLARAEAVVSFYEGGNVWLPEGKPFAGEYTAEHESFPVGANDDQVDATTQVISWKAAKMRIIRHSPVTTTSYPSR